MVVRRHPGPIPTPNHRVGVQALHARAVLPERPEGEQEDQLRLMPLLVVCLLPRASLCLCPDLRPYEASRECVYGDAVHAVHVVRTRGARTEIVFILVEGRVRGGEGHSKPTTG